MYRLIERESHQAGRQKFGTSHVMRNSVDTASSASINDTSQANRRYSAVRSASLVLHIHAIPMTQFEQFKCYFRIRSPGDKGDDKCWPALSLPRDFVSCPSSVPSLSPTRQPTHRNPGTASINETHSSSLQPSYPHLQGNKHDAPPASPKSCPRDQKPTTPPINPTQPPPTPLPPRH